METITTVVDRSHQPPVKRRQITARIIADSISPLNVRLLTYVVTYPRFIHAEHLRHRMHSFNVSSSRAIPGSKFADLVRQAELEPVWWGKNQAGMQAREELTGVPMESAKRLWHEAREIMQRYHALLLNGGLHKQIANRILEAWMPVTVLVSATDWANFFYQRSHPDAQPEIQALSDAMLYQYVNHEPTRVERGEWHMPFGNNMEDSWDELTRRKVAVARCARLSYLTFEGQIDLLKDLELHDKLVWSGHWSPFEHVAQCVDDGQYHANFFGWVQYRKSFPSEYRPDQTADLPGLLKLRQAAGSVYAEKPDHV